MFRAAPHLELASRLAGARARLQEHEKAALQAEVEALRKDLALAALEEKQAGQKRVALEGQLAACESALRPPSKQRQKQLRIRSLSSPRQPKPQRIHLQNKRGG